MVRVKEQGKTPMLLIVGSIRPGARFSKVPKLYGLFSGVTIPSVSQERRGFESSNFTAILLFVTSKSCQKIGFPEQAVDSFTNGFSGRKVFGTFEKRAPGPSRSNDGLRYPPDKSLSSG